MPAPSSGEGGRPSGHGQTPKARLAPTALPRSRPVQILLSEKPAFSNFALGHPCLGLRLYISGAHANWGRGSPHPGAYETRAIRRSLASSGLFPPR